nr:CidA/LrgA family protein [uncultured Sellimonas sp.]
MKILRQFMIILLISFVGEAMHELIPLPVPASVYGLILMVMVLKTGILKLDQVKEAAKLLIAIMPVMFIPAAVGLMTAWKDLRPILGSVAVITVLTTVIVMAVTGLVTQGIIRKKQKGTQH